MLIFFIFWSKVKIGCRCAIHWWRRFLDLRFWIFVNLNLKKIRMFLFRSSFDEWRLILKWLIDVIFKREKICDKTFFTTYTIQSTNWAWKSFFNCKLTLTILYMEVRLKHSSTFLAFMHLFCFTTYSFVCCRGKNFDFRFFFFINISFAS